MLMDRLFSGHQRAEEADPDAALLRVLRADPDALAKLYADYYPRLHGFLMRVLRQPADVEEIINDTMLVVWLKAHRFRGDSRPASWILGIAYRTALKRLRKVSRRAEEELTGELRLVDPTDPGASVAPHRCRTPSTSSRSGIHWTRNTQVGRYRRRGWSRSRRRRRKHRSRR